MTMSTEHGDNANGIKPSNSLEIAIFNATSARLAYTSSADRLELCAEGSSINGGTTPSLSTLQTVIASLQDAQSDPTKSIPIYTMIRPRGGDFVYSDAEFEVMKEQLLALKFANYSKIKSDGSDNKDNNVGFGKVSGFVFGILTKDHKFDRTRNAELVRLAAPLPCTFHRAFDEVITSCEREDYRNTDSSMTSTSASNGSSSALVLPAGVIEELEALISAGFASILTSGGSGRNALEGAQQIDVLTRVADGRITIIAGGGVRSTNLRELRSKSPRTVFFHSSAIVGNVDGQVDVASPDEVLSLKREAVAPLS